MPLPEGRDASFKDIPFLVTDRNMAFIKENHVFDLYKELANWPRGSLVIVSGSGSYRRLEQDLYKLRPDLQVISVDPTLGLEDSTHTVQVETPTVFIYKPKSQQSQTPSNPDFNTIQRQRRNSPNLLDALAISATFPDLPLSDSSVDVFVDIFGPFPMPLSFTQKNVLGAGEKMLKNITTLLRILKPGGTAYLTGIHITARDYFTKIPNIKVQVISHNDAFIEEEYTEAELRAEYLKEEVPVPEYANIKVTKLA